MQRGSSQSRAMGSNEKDSGGGPSSAANAANVIGSPAATRASVRKRAREEGGPSSSPLSSNAAAPTNGSTVSNGMVGSSGTIVGSSATSVLVAIPSPVVWVGDRIGSHHYAAAQFAGRVYHVNDTVLLHSGSALPFVCRIERMMQKGVRKVMQVRWFFRPQDVPEAAQLLRRQPYSQEVFLTDVVEENELATILSRCYVLPPVKYAHLSAHVLDSNVFCCSMFFDSTRDKFFPLQSLAAPGPIFSDPPARAPRLNMPEVPLSGVIPVGFRGLKKKKPTPQGQEENEVNDEDVICCVEDCDNVCWTKRPLSAMRSDWVYKLNGTYVCEEHLSKDKKIVALKRERQTSTQAGDVCDMWDEEGENRKRSAVAKELDLLNSRDLTEQEQVVVSKKNPLCTRGVIVHVKQAGGFTSIAGEVIIHASTTIAEVRQMIKEELGIAFPFVLKKCNIPLPRNIDQKKACLFFSSEDDILIVVPKQLY